MANPELSPTLKRFLGSTEGKRTLKIIGSGIETPPQVTLLEQADEERYYSLEVNQATGRHKEIIDVVLTSGGNWQDFRSRTYLDDRLVTVTAMFKDHDDTRKFIKTRDPSLESYNVPTTEFFSGGFLALYGLRTGINIMVIGYHREGNNIIQWERRKDGNWTSSTYRDADGEVIGAHQIAINRTSAQLKIMENSTKNQITLTAPLRLNVNSWFQQMSVPDRSWLNLAHNFPLKLQVISHPNPQGRPQKNL